MDLQTRISTAQNELATQDTTSRRAVTQRRIAAYLQAVDAAVARLAKDGRTVMVAEAVVAGETRDMTNVVRADVARRMGGLDDGPR